MNGIDTLVVNKVLNNCKWYYKDLFTHSSNPEYHVYTTIKGAWDYFFSGYLSIYFNLAIKEVLSNSQSVGYKYVYVFNYLLEYTNVHV